MIIKSIDYKSNHFILLKLQIKGTFNRFHYQNVILMNRKATISDVQKSD